MTVTELISPQDYLVVERKSLDKHEYRAGRMIRMASTSSTHNLITANVAGTIGMQLRKRPTKIFLCNMRLWIPVINFYAYPDVSIVADEVCLNDNDERDIWLNPTVIVEVLSASTEQYDRDEKFQSYRTIETLQEYLMIAQDTHRVEHYVRQADG